MNQPTVRTFLLESIWGISLDVDLGLKSIVERHERASKSPARVFLLENGVKKFIQNVNFK